MAHPDFRSRELELNSVRAGQLYTDELASRWLRWTVGGEPYGRECASHHTVHCFGGLGLMVRVVGHLLRCRRRRLFRMLVAGWLLSIAAVAIVGSIYTQALARC